MGKTQTPLKILCHPDIAGWEEIQPYIEQGHTVHTYPKEGLDWWNYDLVIGPPCHIMLPEMRKYLPLAVKRVQQAHNRAKKAAKKADKS